MGESSLLWTRAVVADLNEVLIWVSKVNGCDWADRAGSGHRALLDLHSTGLQERRMWGRAINQEAPRLPPSSPQEPFLRPLAAKGSPALTFPPPARLQEPQRTPAETALGRMGGGLKPRWAEGWLMGWSSGGAAAAPQPSRGRRRASRSSRVVGPPTSRARCPAPRGRTDLQVLRQLHQGRLCDQAEVQGAGSRAVGLGLQLPSHLVEVELLHPKAQSLAASLLRPMGRKRVGGT